MLEGNGHIKEVVILDPGLREFGGHHPGIIEGLKNSAALIASKVKITVYGHMDCSDKLMSTLSKGNVNMVRYFNSDFYRYFYSEEKVESFNRYIYELAKEYYQAITSFLNRSVVFLYHTLHWEHATALSLAIKLYQKNNKIRYKHLVCLMYNPCVNVSEKDSIKNLDNAQNRHFKFSIGFRALSKCPSVFLFAAEHELTKNYQTMLGHTVNWHPCGLVSSHHRKDITARKKDNLSKQQSILLYVGDAKDNKGFLMLPKLVKALTEAIAEPDYRFMLQYTITNDRQDLAEVAKALQNQRLKDDRIIIYSDFLSDEDMHSMWLKVNHVVFNYDEMTYLQQSSGVLWLAAIYQAKIYLMTNTWLNREAKRLGCDYHESANVEQLVKQLKRQLLSCTEINEAESFIKASVDYDAKYAQRLFSDLGEWLVEKINPLEGQ